MIDTQLTATCLHHQPAFCGQCRLRGHAVGSCPYTAVEALVSRSMVHKDMWPMLPGVAEALLSRNARLTNPLFTQAANNRSTFLTWPQLQAVFMTPTEKLAERELKRYFTPGALTKLAEGLAVAQPEGLPAVTSRPQLLTIGWGEPPPGRGLTPSAN